MNKAQELKQNLYNLLIAEDAILSVWEGGSKATGFDDDYSDLDLVVVVIDDKVEDTFNQIEMVLKNTCGILRKYRVSEPAWHGFSQAFYQIDQVGPYFYIDLAIIKNSIPDKFLAENRHGKGFVWFEKQKIAIPYLEDKETVFNRCKKHYQLVIQSDFLIMTEVMKNIKRARFTEAFPFYYQFLSRHLSVMLNLKYRKDKVDFGLRYGYRDYPNDIFLMIESALKVSSTRELSNMFDQILELYQNLKTEFSALYA